MQSIQSHKGITDTGGAARASFLEIASGDTNARQGRPRLKKAIADAYSPFFGRTLNPETEVTITTGANEGTSLHLSFLKIDN